MNNHSTLLRHELKSLIDGGIKNIDRFDEILEELDSLARKEQHQFDSEKVNDFSDKF